MNRLHPAILTLAAILFFGVGHHAVSQTRMDGPAAVPGEVLFRLRPGASGGPHTGVQFVTSRLPFFRHMQDVRYSRYTDIWRVKVPDGDDTAETLVDLRTDAEIEFAQPNYRYTNTDASAPDDPLYRDEQQPYYATINAVAGWEVESGSFDIVVAVIDGGVDIAHPELADRIWMNAGDPRDGVDNDGNGCVDDTHGCSLLNSVPDGDVGDWDGHGTFVAGIIGARRDNGAGVTGVAEKVTIMPVRALEPYRGEGTTETLAASILYAARNGADVINLSLTFLPTAGGCLPDAEDPEHLVESALQEAHDAHGATIVAAAGNFGLPCVGYPASSPFTIAVGASGPSWDPDVRGIFADDRSSHWGPEVDVAAPGVDIVSTCPVPVLVPNFCRGEPYNVSRGTSFSTPIVAGAAALLLSQDPGMTNEDVRGRLRSTALPLQDEQTPNWDGAGRLDLGAALGAGSGFAVVDVVAPDTALLDLAVVVGDPASPLCRASLWERPNVHAGSIRGSFGAGECAVYWPPSAVRPWSLYGDSGNRKAARVRGWSLRMNNAICASQATGVIPRGEGVISTNTCASADLVANDHMGAATEVGFGDLPVFFEEEVRYATSASDPLPSCANGVSRGVWYRLDPSAEPTGVEVDTSGSEFVTVLAVYSVDMEELACNFESRSDRSRIVWRTDGVSPYYVFAAALQSVPAGQLRVHLSRADIPVNDAREDALLAPPGDSFPTVEPAHSATSSPDDPALSCKVSYGFSLWFRVPAGSGALTAQTTGSDYDTVVGVFRDDLGALTEVACNDQEGPGVKTSAASWTGDGSDYLIVVGTLPDFAGSVLHFRVRQE